jgi:histone-lysine N-methyltransferase SETMAR
MHTVFWDFQELLLAHFQKHGENVKSASYCEVLLELRDAIRRNPSGQLARGILFHGDSTRAHTARATHERIQELQWALLEHPPYSPDLGPSDFHLFVPLKNPRWWQTFRWLGRNWNEGVEVPETTVSRLPCCGFRRTGKAMGKVYLC